MITWIQKIDRCDDIECNLKLEEGKFKSNLKITEQQLAEFIAKTDKLVHEKVKGAEFVKTLNSSKFELQ